MFGLLECLWVVAPVERDLHTRTSRWGRSQGKRESRLNWEVFAAMRGHHRLVLGLPE